MTAYCMTYEWIIFTDQFAQLGLLFRIAEESGCRLHADTGRRKQTEQGYHVIVFLLYAPSAEKLETVREKLKEQTIFSNWTAINCSDDIEHLTRLEDTPWFFINPWLDSLTFIGRANEIVREKQCLPWPHFSTLQSKKNNRN